MNNYAEYYEVKVESSESSDTESKTFNDILIDISRKHPLVIPAITSILTGVIVYTACTSVISSGVLKGNLKTISYIKRHPQIFR